MRRCQPAWPRVANDAVSRRPLLQFTVCSLAQVFTLGLICLTRIRGALPTSTTTYVKTTPWAISSGTVDELSKRWWAVLAVVGVGSTLGSAQEIMSVEAVRGRVFMA